MPSTRIMMHQPSGMMLLHMLNNAKMRAFRVSPFDSVSQSLMEPHAAPTLHVVSTVSSHKCIEAHAAAESLTHCNQSCRWGNGVGRRSQHSDEGAQSHHAGDDGTSCISRLAGCKGSASALLHGMLLMHYGANCSRNYWCN